jgi:hypothetical protein
VVKIFWQLIGGKATVFFVYCVTFFLLTILCFRQVYAAPLIIRMMCLCMRFVVCFSQYFCVSLPQIGGQLYALTFSDFRRKIIFFLEKIRLFRLYGVNIA